MNRYTRMSRVWLVAAWGLLLSVGWAAADTPWTDLRTGPQARAKHAAVYDSHRKRMILFGGRCYDTCCSDGAVPNDVWMLPLDVAAPQWVEVWPSGAVPPAGLGPVAIYDPVRDRMLVPGASGHVWQLGLSNAPTWSELVPTGTPPPSTSAGVYDPVRDRMIVVASTGRVFTLAFAPDTQWVEILPTGKLPTRIVTALYDPVRDRVVVFADSIRALSLSGPPAWSKISEALPQFLNAYSAIYDPVRDRAVVHGGCIGNNCGTTETWELPLSAPAWNQLSFSGPLISSQSAIYDPQHDRMVVFGGYGLQFYTDWMVDDLWTLSLDPSLVWQELTPAGPPAACRAPAVRDHVRNNMMVYGDSVYVMKLSALPSWTTLSPAGTPPAPRQDYSAIYDPVRDRMVLYGGYDGAVNLHDLWGLSLSPPQWTSLSATGTPPPVAGPAIYDPVRDRMLVFRGALVSQLPLATPLAWSDVVASGTPPDVTSGFSAVYDSPGDRVLVFGGQGVSGLENTVWQLALSPSPAWTALAPSGSPPAPRADHMAVFDATRGRMVIAGGNTGGPGSATDTWALSLIPSPAWQQLITAGTARGQTAIYDLQRDRIVSLAACDTPATPTCVAALPRTWQLPFNSVLDAPRSSSVGKLSLTQSRPNPARAPLRIPFTIPRPGAVTLHVYDLSGRLVASLFDGRLPAGEHVVHWNGTDGGNQTVSAGVYFYELRSSGERLQRRLILLR